MPHGHHGGHHGHGGGGRFRPRGRFGGSTVVYDYGGADYGWAAAPCIPNSTAPGGWICNPDGQWVQRPISGLTFAHGMGIGELNILDSHYGADKSYMMHGLGTNLTQMGATFDFGGNWMPVSFEDFVKHTLLSVPSEVPDNYYATPEEMPGGGATRENYWSEFNSGLNFAGPRALLMGAGAGIVLGVLGTLVAQRWAGP